MTSSAIMTSSSASLGSPAGASSSQYLHPDYLQMMPSSVSIHLHDLHSTVQYFTEFLCPVVQITNLMYWGSKCVHFRQVGLG